MPGHATGVTRQNGGAMPDKRRAKTKSARPAGGTQQPLWKQAPRRKRKRVSTGQQVSLRARLGQLKSSLVERRSRPKTSRAVAARPALVHVPWRRLVLLPLVVTLTFALLQFFMRDQFYVYSAEIRGNQRVPADQIYAASHVDKQHIFWIRPNQAAGQVKDLPGIADAHVSMALPNKVTIEVQEREPLVAVQTISTTTWFAADGTALPQVGSAPPLRLIDTEGAASNGQGRLRLQVLADIQALHARLPDLTSVDFGAQEGLTFRSPGGFTVYLGNEGNIATRLDLLQAVQGQIASRKTPPKVVDLRVDGNAYLR
jgi:cell division septal protein FtsQ